MVGFLVLFVFVQQFLLVVNRDATTSTGLGNLVLCFFGIVLLLLFLLLQLMTLVSWLFLVLVGFSAA